jgi:hypothetical protein
MSSTFLVYVWLVVVVLSIGVATVVRRFQNKKYLSLEDGILASIGLGSAIMVVALLVKLHDSKGLQTELGLDGTIIYLIGCGVTLVVALREVRRLF